MSVDKVREYLRSYGLEDRIMEFGISPRHRCGSLCSNG